MEAVMAKGHVDTFIVAPDGTRTRVEDGDNTVSYLCADAAASLFAGRGGAPAKVVFAYSASANNGDNFIVAVDPRVQVEGNIIGSGLTPLIAQVDPNPSISSSSTKYAGNVVKFRATASSTSDAYIYGYLLEDADGNVLATRKLTHEGVLKPAGYAISVSWSVTFM